MNSLTKPFWPEPAGVRGKPCGTTVALVGELAYVLRQTSHQGLAYMTGVLRVADSDGEMPIEIPPTIYARVGGLLGEGEIRMLTCRIDRRGPVHILTVHDVEAVAS